MERSARLNGLSIQQDLCDDLEAALLRALDQRNEEILLALDDGISERTVAAAVRKTRSFINKVRRTRGTSRAAA